MAWSVEILNGSGKPYSEPIWYHGYKPDRQVIGSSVLGASYQHEEEAMQAIAEAPKWLRPRLRVTRIVEKVAK